MKKSCPACGRPVSDETKQFCPTCEKLELSDSKFSHEDFERLSQVISGKLRADWKFKLQIIASVFGVVLLLIGVIDAIVGFNLNERMSNHFTAQENQATNRINKHLGNLDDDVRKALAQVDVQMRSNIARNFRAPAVQTIIQEVAKAEAKDILEGEVQPAVARFRADALFIRTVARAQAYDFKAYQQLLELRKQTNDNAQLANQVLAEIDRSLARDRSQFSPRRTFASVSGTNTYGGPFTSDELASKFSIVAQNQITFNREGFVNTIADLKQPLFLPKLIEFFTNETDLAVADRVTIAISGLAKEDFHPRDFERIQTWWHSHQNKYTNWPITEFEIGLNSFVGGNYSQGFKSLQKVLELDASADQSRALAIVCGFEIGETNKVAELAKGFKQPDARWAQWAAAFVELRNGSVSNATVRFAELTRKQPTMQPFMPAENVSVWRKLDWQLFRKLTAAEKP